MDDATILLLQAGIAAIGVILSIIVANRWGELAATRYTLNESRRREHAQVLVTEIQRLGISYVESIFDVWVNQEKLAKHKVNIHYFMSSNIELFLAHLETGYNSLYKDILNYQDNYNKKVDTVLAIYNKALTILNEFSAKQSVRWAVGPPRVIEAFVGEVIRRLVHQNQPNVATIIEHNVMFGNQILASADNVTEEEKIRDIVNSLFERQEIFGELKTVWKDIQPIGEKHKNINKQLEQISAYVNSGVYLSGSCPAGKAAGYE